MSSSTRFHIVWLAVVCVTMPLGVVVSTHLARRSFEKVNLRDQTISVKGYAEQDITSDRATWYATITQRSPTLVEAYAQLEVGRAALVAQLARAGFPDPTLSAVGVDVVYEKMANGNATNKIEYFTLSQSASIGSDRVADVARAAQGASELIKGGVELSSSSPQYVYTKLNDLKLKMLGDAAANARERAGQLVSHGGGRLGAMRSASQGVFQITPAFSTEVSNSGENDTTSIRKVIKAVVTQTYAIE